MGAKRDRKETRAAISPPVRDGLMASPAPADYEFQTGGGDDEWGTYADCLNHEILHASNEAESGLCFSASSS